MVTMRYKPQCDVSGCERQADASHGWCRKHYQRWTRYGDPTGSAPKKTRTRRTYGPRTGTVEDRFWARVDKDSSPDGCWLFTGSTTPDGYGQFSANGKKVSAHRWAYTHFVGPIPRGLIIDHVYENGCRNRNCVNYEQHLEPVTQSENALRRWRAELA